MIYRDFQDLSLSLLGFGTMRLPLNEDKTIDKEATREMVKYAMDHGVNYFDTAYPYHEGRSELVIGEILSEYPRDSFYLATKYPGHQPVAHFTPKETFEEQLKKCRVDYFDFYLLHNVCENSMKVYLDKEIGIMDYFIEQKKLGKIKHLGFSTHGAVDNMKEFLDLYGDEMEFCQIQMNYLDYTLQHAKEKYELLTERNIPVWVMEPLRGGKLTNTSEAFRWLERFPNIKMILSGMSNIDHMMENVAIFHAEDPLSDLDTVGVYQRAETMKNSVPCTACHYCDGCPMDLDIPTMMDLLSQHRAGTTVPVTMYLESLPEEKLPQNCIECGACSEKCPQKIDIPQMMMELNEKWQGMAKWADVCREREVAAKKLSDEIRNL